jgi:Protein of unknown function (DUF2510)
VSEQPPTEYAPPGWFPDPTGLQAQRWWDGTQWGEQTRPVAGSEQELQVLYQAQPSYGQPDEPSSTPDPQYGTPPGEPPYPADLQYGGTPFEQPDPQARPYGQHSGHPDRSARKSWLRRDKLVTVIGSLAALIIVIGGIASTSGNAKQADNASAVALATPTSAPTPSRAPTHHAKSTKPAPKKTPVTVQATPAPALVVAPLPSATAPPVSCHSHWNEGTSYKPGEYCHRSHHGMRGWAGDGRMNTRGNHDGWH